MDVRQREIWTADSWINTTELIAPFDWYFTGSHRRSAQIRCASNYRVFGNYAQTKRCTQSNQSETEKVNIQTLEMMICEKCNKVIKRVKVWASWNRLRRIEWSALAITWIILVGDKSQQLYIYIMYNSDTYSYRGFTIWFKEHKQSTTKK